MQKDENKSNTQQLRLKHHLLSCRVFIKYLTVGQGFSHSSASNFASFLKNVRASNQYIFSVDTTKGVKWLRWFMQVLQYFFLSLVVPKSICFQDSSRVYRSINPKCRESIDHCDQHSQSQTKRKHLVQLVLYHRQASGLD